MIKLFSVVLLITATAINLVVVIGPVSGQNYPQCTQKCGNAGNEGGGAG
jgi:hypothetical protein